MPEGPLFKGAPLSGGPGGEGGGEKAAGSNVPEAPSSKSAPPPGAKAQDAAGAAEDSFAKGPPSAVVACPLPPKGTPGKAPPGKKAPPPAWTAKDLTDALQKCDGGTDAFKKSQKATIRVAPSVLKTGGNADAAKNEVVIDPPPKFGRCEQIETLVHELTNLSNAKKFDKAGDQCLIGDLDRESWIKTNEEVEYDGVTTALKAFDGCHKQWGCKSSSFEWARPFKDFDHYYKSISKGHKEYWGKWWDTNCKGPYNTKHPTPPKKAPPPPPKKGPPGAPPKKFMPPPGPPAPKK